MPLRFLLERIQYAPTIIITMLSFLRGNDIFSCGDTYAFTNGGIGYYLLILFHVHA